MKRKSLIASLLFLISLSIFVSGCKDDPVVPSKPVHQFTPATASQESIQEILITMGNCDTLEFAAGTYDFIGTLSIEGKEGIVIRGAGKGNTILNFSGQTQGAQGFYVANVNWFLLQDLTIKDAVGDGIKLKDSDGISLIGVGVEYSGTPSQDNGAYGIYPVTCSNVYIDNCYVRGASDAGIYVGQSTDVIVSNNTVTENVAGMEIENCIRADVFGNTATRNTGGIMAFDLENLPVIPNGNTCRIYDNTVVDNSYPSFAPPGNTVGAIPVGTGIMILSYDGVEVFNNTITNNNVMGIGIVSMNTLRLIEGDTSPYPADYDEYVYNINIHDNTITRTADYPPAADRNPSADLLTSLFPANEMPDIIYDGYIAPTYVDNNDTTEGICIQGNGTAGFGDVSAGTAFMGISTDVTPHICTQDPLTAVTVEAPGL